MTPLNSAILPILSRTWTFLAHTRHRLRTNPAISLVKGQTEATAPLEQTVVPDTQAAEEPELDAWNGGKLGIDGESLQGEK
jgi:hypothetical protein